VTLRTPVPPVLILSRPRDAHVPIVTRLLQARDVPYCWFDPADFPAAARLRLQYDRSGRRIQKLEVGGQSLDLATVRSVWLRRPGHPAPPPLAAPDLTRYAAEESRLALWFYWETLDARWVPGKPSRDDQADNKLRQLGLASSLGLRVPRTLVTNDPAALLEFYEACAGRIITKTLVRWITWGGEERDLHAYPVRRRDLARVASLRSAPVLAQEYIPKRLELRITVVGERVFAAEIHSQATTRTRYDWRHYDHGATPYAIHTLPAPIEQRCRRIVQAQDLCYGAIDMVLTPAGEYVFLECNPNGQWGWIENEVDFPIAEAVTDLLVRTDEHAAGRFSA
jgi:MvdD pre-ATP grasp domain